MEKQVVEINGHKFEVDITAARRITELKVGDPIKVLKKEYSDSWKSHPGVIVGFDAFQVLPTVTVAYLEVEYSGAAMKYAYFNANSKDIELAPVSDATHLGLEKSRILDMMDKEIQKKELEVEEAKAKRQHFLNRFGKLFPEVRNSENQEVTQ